MPCGTGVRYGKHANEVRDDRRLTMECTAYALLGGSIRASVRSTCPEWVGTVMPMPRGLSRSLWVSFHHYLDHIQQLTTVTFGGTLVKSVGRV